MRERLYERPDLLYKIVPIKPIRLAPLVFEKVSKAKSLQVNQSLSSHLKRVTTRNLLVVFGLKLYS